MFGKKKTVERFEMASVENKPKPSNSVAQEYNYQTNPPSQIQSTQPEQVETLAPVDQKEINYQNNLYQQTNEQLEYHQQYTEQEYAQVIAEEERKAQEAYYASLQQQQMAQQQPVEAVSQPTEPATVPITQPATAIVAENPAPQVQMVDPNTVAYYTEQEQALQQALIKQQALAQQQVAEQSMLQQNAIANTQAVVGQSPAQQPQLEQSATTPASSEVSLPESSSVLNDQTKKVERPVKRFNYVILNNLGKKEKGAFDAESENDVRTFLINQDYQVLEVKERSKLDIDIGGGKINSSDLSFCLTQLSTYLKSGIALADSVKILAKQTKKAKLKRAFNQVVYQLLRGESFSDALTMQGNTFPKLLINMVKTAEMTGDLPSILDDMAEYYTAMEQTKKQMKSAMTYPAVVLTIALGVLVFMLTYLVPQFTAMFESQGAELPFLTKTIMNISNIIKTKWYVIILTIAAIVGGFMFCYKKIQPFRKIVQIILMHMPVVGNVIIYNETANFSKTFASLLNHSVFITDSMEILSKITTNEIFISIISKTLENLSKGDSISSAFRGEWAIPVVAYEMIVTGETTGQLGAMMEKVAAHFQMLHKNIIDQMKSLIEPIMICFLAVVVGIILVSIIQPMFSIYSQIK